MKDIATEQYNLADIIREGWSTYRAILKKSLPILLLVMLPLNWIISGILSRSSSIMDEMMRIANVTTADSSQNQANNNQTDDKSIQEEHPSSHVVGTTSESQADITSAQYQNNFLNNPELTKKLVELFVLQIQILLLLSIIGGIALLALMKLSEMHITCRTITWGEAFSHGISRYPRFLLALTVVIIISIAAIFISSTPTILALRTGSQMVITFSRLLMIATLFYLFTKTAFFPYATGLTSATGIRSLRYSFRLLRGQFWKNAIYLLTILIFCLLISRLVSTLGVSILGACERVSHFSPAQIWPRIQGTFGLLAANLVLPLYTSLMTIFFLNTAYLEERAVR